MSIPDISVIVPVYKAEKYIDRIDCVRSILSQTYGNIELILVDDGSPDRCPVICDEYAKTDSRVKVIHMPNGGVSSARNAGLDAAQGEYIMFCDSDDAVGPEWCECMIHMMSDRTCDLAVCGFQIFEAGKETETDRRIFSDKEYDVCVRSEIHKLHLCEMLGAMWNKIFRRDIIRSDKLYLKTDVSHGEDQIFVMQYIQHSSGEISVCNRTLYRYVKENNESLSTVADRYVPNLWDQLMCAEDALIHTFDICGVDPHSIQFMRCRGTKYVAYICIKNNMSEKNPDGTREKIRANHRILHSEQFQELIRYGYLDHAPLAYRCVLKTKCSWLVYLYIKGSELKNRHGNPSRSASSKNL